LVLTCETHAHTSNEAHEKCRPDRKTGVHTDA
jgi:hypothetical protein